MSSEVYTPKSKKPNGEPPRSPKPQRAGELLPELFRQYAERIAAANARPGAIVSEQLAASLGISIVAVPQGGSDVVTGRAPLVAIAAPAAIRS
jgi:hypothetical protein